MKHVKDREQPLSSINLASAWSTCDQEGQGTRQGSCENGGNPGQQRHGSGWESVTAPSWNASTLDPSSEANMNQWCNKKIHNKWQPPVINQNIHELVSPSIWRYASQDRPRIGIGSHSCQDARASAESAKSARAGSGLTRGLTTRSKSTEQMMGEWSLLGPLIGWAHSLHLGWKVVVPTGMTDCAWLTHSCLSCAFFGWFISFCCLALQL